jgi:hypothetical protein
MQVSPFSLDGWLDPPSYYWGFYFGVQCCSTLRSCFSLLGFFEVGGFSYLQSQKLYLCDCYKISFHLWGNGGPRLNLELANFNKEEAASWSVIRKNEPSSKPRSFADAVKSRLLSGANSIPLRVSTFHRLEFPQRPSSRQRVLVHRQAQTVHPMAQSGSGQRRESQVHNATSPNLNLSLS